MIAHGLVWRKIAKAIQNSIAVKEVLAEFNDPLRFHVGHDATAALQQASSPMVSVSPMDVPVDFGHFAATRDFGVMIRFAFTDDEMTDDGVEITYRGALTLDKLGRAILGALKEIDELGDELAQANLYLDTNETFPLCSGRIECLFRFTNTLATEPSLSEI